MKFGSTLYREYCVTCKDYTLHRNNKSDNLICECGTICVETPLSEIDSSILETQRARYRKWRGKKFEDLYYTAMAFGGMPEKRYVIEADAGYEAIKEAEYQRRVQLRNTMREFVEKNKSLGRNENCSCNSGKKYKKCCLPTTNKYLIELVYI